MPRKSKSSLSVVSPSKRDTYPVPPANLTNFETALWMEIVRTKPVTWWDEASIRPLLLLVAAEKALLEINQMLTSFPKKALYTDEGLRRYEKLNKMRREESAIVLRELGAMRLTHQSRYDKRNAAEGASKMPGVRPWTTYEEEADGVKPRE